MQEVSIHHCVIEIPECCWECILFIWFDWGVFVCLFVCFTGFNFVHSNLFLENQMRAHCHNKIYFDGKINWITWLFVHVHSPVTLQRCDTSKCVNTKSVKRSLKALLIGSQGPFGDLQRKWADFCCPLVFLKCTAVPGIVLLRTACV